MLRKHGLGKHNIRGILSRMPRAIVRAVLGLVLTVAHGQSEASPFYHVGVVPMVPFPTIQQQSRFPVADEFISDIPGPGVGKIAGGAVAGPRGIGASALSSISLPSPNGSFAAIFAWAGMEVSDMVITPSPGTHVTRLVPGALKLNFSGNLVI